MAYLMTDTEIDTDEIRIKKQRVAKRDLLLPNIPQLDNLNTIFVNIIKFHIFFCLLILILAMISPMAAKFIAMIVSPIAKIALFLNPNQGHFTGEFGDEFYLSLTWEAFLVGFLTFSFYQIMLIGRYWRYPWRFNEYYLEQLGFKRTVISAFLTAVISSMVAALMGAILLHWCYFQFQDQTYISLKPFQLILWCYFVPAASLVFSLMISLAISSILATVRRLTT